MPDRRPPPIRTDGTNAFARRTMEVRIPATLRETIDRNPDYPAPVKDALARLHDDIVSGAPLALFAPPAPDHDDWAARLAAHAGETWLDADWFFAEVYFFRLVLAATRYWGTLRDPFAPFKEEELASAALWEGLEAALAAEGDVEAVLSERLMQTLWGNRIDLNMKASAALGTTAAEEHLLADDLPRAVDLLVSRPPGAVHVVMDNAGTEQALDYALVDLLLGRGVAEQVVLHVKLHPLFVSDVVVPDVYRLLALMAARGGAAAALAGRLSGHLGTGRLQVAPDAFWNTDGMLWALPPRLHTVLREARLVLLKGDANYRRATHDAVWTVEASLSEAMRGFPAPLLALRTLKSDTLVGVPLAVQARLDAEAGADWRSRGEYGVAQLGLPEG